MICKVACNIDTYSILNSTAYCLHVLDLDLAKYIQYYSSSQIFFGFAYPVNIIFFF